MQKRANLLLVLLLLLSLLLLQPAQAGWNEMTVDTDGEGIAVYAASNGRKKVGVLYNGYYTDLSLEDTNGLYSCWLTRDLTVWVNQDQATRYRKAEGEARCNLFMVEVVQEYAPMYTSTNHKTVCVKHAPGTLLRICGELGDDYYVDMGSYQGLISKDDVVFYADIAAKDMNDWRRNGLPVEERSVYTGGGLLAVGYAATGYSDIAPRTVKDGEKVQVLRVLGDWAQLTSGAFIETRFLDPNGDHSIRYATVKSSKVLNRLNVRYAADKDSSVVVKLCAGTRVQVPSRTEEWAAVFIAGEGGGLAQDGCVMTEYLVFDDADVPNGCTRVRLKETLAAGYDGHSYRMSWDGVPMLAGTELTVIGVYDGFDISDDSGWADGDIFLCMTDKGRLVRIFNDDGVLEAVEPLNIKVKTGSSVRMREKADKNAAVIRTLPAGTKVQVLLRGEGWTMVEYKDQVGYVMSRYLKFP